MITRLWRGGTTTTNADDTRSSCYPDSFHRVAFVTLTRFETLDAVQTFSGEEYETPVLEPIARRLLSR
jgi:hypothetical protein